MHSFQGIKSETISRLLFGLHLASQIFKKNPEEIIITITTKPLWVCSTFIAPLVAIALNDIEVKNVQEPQKATSMRPSPMPAIPTILQREAKS